MKLIASLLCVICSVANLQAQDPEVKKELQEFNGFFNFKYSESEDKIYLEVDKLDQEFLYVHSLTTGLGSNDIGLDRGQLGDGVIVKFIKAGNKLLLLQPNQDYRAITDNSLEKQSVEQAFAKSVLHGFPITKTEGDTHTIDLTPFLMLDAHGVAQRLKRGKEGNYSLDPKRNVLWMEKTKAFPLNVEFEAMLTFKGEPTGGNIRSVAPDSNSLTVIQHHSFVKLPDNNYTPREFDPRSGAISTSYLDYATPIWEPIRKRVIVRHRLSKKNPELPLSEAVEPIIYYLDPGTPEPVRSALLEGGRWWNQAFESIGYKDAFQVKMLPEGADPMDLRYNMIQWVHRSTRGWSYGASIVDPRTGEILKGHVSLGSLRIRQDFMIAQALMNQPFANNDANYGPMLEMALARIRQLSAHEIGHTLGFAHNFAASPYGRASVMDYPHPTLSMQNGVIDFSNAYSVDIGAWDKVTVAYSYGNPSNGASEADYLNTLLENAFANGLQFISDSDARAQNGAHGRAHLWDNGADATQELLNVLAIREQAIKNFGIHNIRTGEPLTVLEDVFVPLYFFHRYQTEAAVKKVGGMDYNYAVKGSPGTITTALPRDEQRDALNAVLETVLAKNLMIPEDKLELFPPRAFGFWRGRESFKSNVGVSFDPIGAAATASDLTFGLLFNAQRANRILQQNALDNKQMPIAEFLDRVMDQLYTNINRANSNYEKEVARIIFYRGVQHLMNLAINASSLPQVKGAAQAQLGDIIAMFSTATGNDFRQQVVREIQAFRAYPEKFTPMRSPSIPDGSPIGSMECFIND